MVAEKVREIGAEPLLPHDAGSSGGSAADRRSALTETLRKVWDYFRDDRSGREKAELRQRGIKVGKTSANSGGRRTETRPDREKLGPLVRSDAPRLPGGSASAVWPLHGGGTGGSARPRLVARVAAATRRLPGSGLEPESRSVGLQSGGRRRGRPRRDASHFIRQRRQNDHADAAGARSRRTERGSTPPPSAIQLYRSEPK